MLTFDSATHTYRWNGALVPGVTSILQPLQDFSRVPPEILKAAQERGTYVHRMTELFDLGRLDEPALLASPDHAVYHGYLRAWKAFLDEFDPAWEDIEAMGYSQRYGFAGTWDRTGELLRKAPGYWLIDVKTSIEDSQTWGIQTAAYRQIKSESNPNWMLARRGTVQLRANGDFEFKPWDATDDWNTFVALLTIRNWRSKHDPKSVA